MNNWGIVIRNLRKDRGITQFELSDKTGITRSKISLIELGKVKTYDNETLVAIAKALEMPPAELRLRLHGEFSDTGEILQSSFYKVKILGNIPAGTPAANEEQDLGYIFVENSKLGGKRLDNLFALRVNGSSLIGDGIQDGGTLIIEKNTDIVDGKIYIVRIHGNETVARHLFRKDGMIVLTSSNGFYQEMKLEEVEVIGRIIKFFPAEISF